MTTRFLSIISLASMTSLFGSSFAQAEVLASLGAQLSFETATDGRSLETRQPWAVRAGYRFPIVDLEVEASYVSQTQGTSMVRVARARTEAMLWARYLVRTKMRLVPTLGLGGGFVADRIDTTFDGSSRSDWGQPQSAFAASAGFLFPFHENFELILEGRIAHSIAFANSWRPSMMFALGWKF